MVDPSRATSGPSLERALRSNHEWIDAVLDDIVLVAQSGRLDETRTLFAIFARRLRRHLEIEEELFDALAPPDGTELATLIVDLREEHRILFGKIEQTAVALDEPPRRESVLHPSISELLALRQLLTRHEEKETPELYRHFDQRLSPRVRSAAVRNLDRRIF